MILKHLSTSNSKKNISFDRPRKCLKIVAEILITVIVICCAIAVLNFLYVEPDEHSRSTWHLFYNLEEPIDSVIIGSSHVYCDVNPDIIDEKAGTKSFDLSISSMRMEQDFYALKEADRVYDIKNAYIEVYYAELTKNSSNTRSSGNIYNNWKSTDYMKPSYVKYSYIFDIYAPEKYIDTFIPFVRFREHLFDSDYIKERLTQKMSEEYKSYNCNIYSDEGWSKELCDNGYRKTVRYVEPGNPETGDAFYFSQRRDFTNDSDNLGEEAEQYLRKAIEYSRAHNINLTLFVSPIYDTEVISTVDYDRYTNRIGGIAAEYGVPFYDFNLAKIEYLNIYDPKYYQDAGHLNDDGATLYSSVWADVMHSDTPKEYFYTSYSEKLADEVPKVFGIYYYKNNDSYSYVIASNRDSGFEYQAEYTYADGYTDIIRDWSEDKILDFTPQAGCSIKITMKDSSTGLVQGEIAIPFN